MNRYVSKILCGFLLIFSVGFSIYDRNKDFFDKTPKISVIVPVYNTEKYLNECLNSAENQTLKNIEIVCINDGSTDRSLEILKEHANKDSRIKVISQENKGLSSARNAGMRSAKGKYIALLDSDDVLVPWAYEKMYNLAEKHKADAVKCGSMDFFQGDPFKIGLKVYNNSKVEIFKKCGSKTPFEQLKYDCGVVWNRIYNRKFLKDNNIWFKDGLSLAEDTVFNWLCGAYAKKHVITHNILYFYRKNRTGSLMSTDYNDLKKRFDVYIDVIQWLSDNRDRFVFKNRDEWIISRMLLTIYYQLVKNLKDEKKMQSYYANKSVKIINKFISDHDVNISGTYLNEINCLRSIAEGADSNI